METLNCERKMEARNKTYSPKWNQIALFIVVLLISTSGFSVADDTDIEEPSEHIHLSWTKDRTRFDFIFSPNATIRNISRLESDSNNYLRTSLVDCQGHSACLFQNATLINHFELSEPPSSEYHRSRYVSRSQGDCAQIQIKVLHYCTTHLNPPAYLYKHKCSHTIEWRSPLTCHSNSTNHERPCYIYDHSGNLIDLTTWIRSDGSSYKVNTTFAEKSHSIRPKGFYINVCNEAFDMCGPNVSACFKESSGLVEAGYNNLTSIKYDAKANNTVILTSLGHLKEGCEGSRLKTEIRFLCKKLGTRKVNDVVGPKLIKSDDCANVIEWETIHACPSVDTVVPVLPGCKLKYDPLGIDIDVRRLTNNVTQVEVTHIDHSNKTMVLGICKPLPKSLNCEDRKVSSISACLIDNIGTEGWRNNSQVVGFISKSNLKLADDRLYLESTAVDKTCSTLVEGRNDFEVTRPIGVRIEFICSAKQQNLPTYSSFKDCTYVFVWGSPLMCFESRPEPAEKVKNLNETSSPFSAPPPNVASLPPRPATSDDIAKKIAIELHKETLDDTTKVNQAIIHHDVHHNREPMSSHSKEQSEKKTIEPELKKMDWLYKSFMISLIVMSSVAFFVLIFVLDKKTRLSTPLSSFRRRTLPSFQAEPVPYTRVFNDPDL